MNKNLLLYFNNRKFIKEETTSIIKNFNERNIILNLNEEIQKYGYIPDEKIQKDLNNLNENLLKSFSKIENILEDFKDEKLLHILKDSDSIYLNEEDVWNDISNIETKLNGNKIEDLFNPKNVRNYQKKYTYFSIINYLLEQNQLDEKLYEIIYYVQPPYVLRRFDSYEENIKSLKKYLISLSDFQSLSILYYYNYIDERTFLSLICEYISCFDKKILSTLKAGSDLYNRHIANLGIALYVSELKNNHSIPEKLRSIDNESVEEFFKRFHKKRP